MYPIEDKKLSGPLTPPRSPTRSPEALERVIEFTESPSNPSLFRPSSQKDNEKDRAIEVLSPNVRPEPKKVHWTSNIQENQNKSKHKSKPRHSRSGDETRPASSKSNPRMKLPSVPEAPRSRGTPPTPRPQRLPTPDLPDLKCGGFCDCCYEGAKSKMDAQLAAATSHIMSSRQSQRRLAYM